MADRALDFHSEHDLLALRTDLCDKLLVDVLDEIHQRRRHEPITVAVVYGAAHVAPVVHGMQALYGYASSPPSG